MTRLVEIMRTLRDPEKGCPWDREQDFSSIAPYTIEESYEVADAIERDDMKGLCSELGDLLFQVVYHAQLAAEKGHFTFIDVVNTINSKLLERHPHVFGDAKIESASEQSLAWEKLKARERAGNSKENTVTSILEQISLNLPALSRAQKLQSRAAVAGFDWTDIRDVKAKIEEELKELEAELSGIQNKTKIQEEMGDILFACVNLSRHLSIDAESTLRSANRKFENRFRYIEEQLKKQDKTVEQATLDEMETLWQEAKLFNKPE